MSNSTICVSASSCGTPRTTVTAGDFSYLIDEPEIFGGKNEAPSPVAHLLGAVAGCVVAIGCYMAREQGFVVRHLEVSAAGEINSDNFFGISDETRAGFQKLTLDLTLDSTASEQQLAAWETQLAKRCPVLDNLLHPLELSIHCK